MSKIVHDNYKYLVSVMKDYHENKMSLETEYEIGDCAGYISYNPDNIYEFEFSSQDVWLKARDLFSFEYIFEAMLNYQNWGY